jgi:uncharacterized lipoprotein YbaY
VNDRERTVRVSIQFDAGLPSSAAGTQLYVRLLDVTTADVPARVVSENVSHLVAGSPMSFELPAPGIDERGRYVVSCHADLDGDGVVSQGDYITMQSYPVLTLGYPDRAEILLKRVE